MFLILVTFLLFAFNASEGSECDTNGTTCIDFQHYQQCKNVNGQYRLVGNVTACPDGTACDHSSGTAVCTKISFVQTFQSEGGPQCDGPGKHPSSESCYQYHECKQVLWWWQPQLQTCPEGLAFDIGTSLCVPQAAAQCGQRPTTTTSTAYPPIEEPECKGSGKYPALLCYQYFECEPKLWWHEPKLKTCPKGQAFDISKKTCVCAGLVNCQLPAADVTCDGPGNQAALTCREYYECSKFLWWWDPKLKQCPSGQIYDKSSCHCVPEETTECFGDVPQCYGFWKYPAANKSEYYECELNEAGNEWIATLQTCEQGLVYISKLGACAPEWYTLFI